VLKSVLEGIYSRLTLTLRASSEVKIFAEASRNELAMRKLRGKRLQIHAGKKFFAPRVTCGSDL